jgi:hypothetical protein
MLFHVFPARLTSRWTEGGRFEWLGAGPLSVVGEWLLLLLTLASFWPWFFDA